MLRAASPALVSAFLAGGVRRLAVMMKAAGARAD